jgi:hypothetical protein
MRIDLCPTGALPSLSEGGERSGEGAALPVRGTA